MEKNERDTLKLRDVRLKISDRDLNTLAMTCGRNGITIQEMFETLIGDLTGGHGYSGSNEGDFADKWLANHSWAIADDNSLLRWLSERYDVQIIEDLIEDWAEKKLYESDPVKYASDMGNTGVAQWWDTEIKDITRGYDGTINDEEIDSLKAWLNEFYKVERS